MIFIIITNLYGRMISSKDTGNLMWVWKTYFLHLEIANAWYNDDIFYFSDWLYKLNTMWKDTGRHDITGSRLLGREVKYMEVI